MNREDQKTDNNDIKMEELRRLLRRLDRAEAGSSAAMVPPSATSEGNLAKPQPPPLPPFPALPPRWPSESVTSEPATQVSSETKGRRLRPHHVVAIAIVAVAGVGLILSIDLPRPGAPTTPYSGGQDVIAAKKNAEPGLIAATGTVPERETPASGTQDVQALALPSTEIASTTTPSAPPTTATATVPVPAAVAEPEPKQVEVEPRTAAIAPTIPEQTAAAPSPTKSGTDASPLLAIPPSFIVEAGVTSPFPLRLTRDRWALDGGYLIVSGLLRGSRFSSGTEIVFDTWQIPVSALGDLQLTIPSDGETELTIELRSARGETLASTTVVLQGVTPAGASQSR